MNSFRSAPFLIFDAYGTLVELDDFYGRLQRGFAHAGHDFSAEVVRQAAHEEMRHYIARSTEARDQSSWQQLRRDCAEIMVQSFRDQNQPFSLPIETTIQILGDSIQFKTFPETLAVLEQLHEQQIPMGVLSNWDYELPRIFEAMGLKKFFCFVLSSAEVGVPKPAPETFAAAIARARECCPGVELSDCFYIGDHYEKDVLPAQEAGLNALWLVRDERDLPSGDDCPDSKVLRLPDLTHLLHHIYVTT